MGTKRDTILWKGNSEKVSEKAIFWNTTAPHLHYVQKALLEGTPFCKDVAILLMTD